MHERVHARARALAAIAGRAPADVSQADYEQAKRESLGETVDMIETARVTISDLERWDPVPGPPAGSQMRESPNEDEDENGRSESEQAAESGVEKAGDEQTTQAARAAEQNARHDP